MVLGIGLFWWLLIGVAVYWVLRKKGMIGG